MAGVSAGEVFVNLVIKGEGVQPALAAASAKVKEFSKGIGAASVATGMLIAEAAKMAFTSLTGAFDQVMNLARIDPATAKGVQDLAQPLNQVSLLFERIGVTILSFFLPYMKMAADAALAIVTELKNFVDWLDSTTVAAGIKTGNIGEAFYLMWLNIQKAGLEALQPILAPLIGMVEAAITLGMQIYEAFKLPLGYVVDAFWETVTQVQQYFEGMYTAFLATSNGMGLTWDDLISSMADRLAELVQFFGRRMQDIAQLLKYIAPALPKDVRDMLNGQGVALQLTTGDNLKTAWKDMTSSLASFSDIMKGGLSDVTSTGNEVLDGYLKSLEDKIGSMSQKLQGQMKDAQKGADEAIAKNTASRAALSGTFAVSASGGNIMYQTQKDMLRELKEQKDLARQQLEEQRKLNQKDGARFK